MKKITLFIALLMVSIGFSQQSVIQDFEAAGGLGEAFGSAAGSVVSDPETGGTRGQVAMLSANAAGAVWQGININISDNYELVSDKTMQMDVYSTIAIEFAPKAQGGLSGAPESVSSVSHTGSGWETLTITYDKSLDGKAPANGVYTQLALHYLWDIDGGSWATPDSRVFYIDNIKATLSVAVDATLPTVASPAVDVSITGGTAGTDYISIFSDELTNITVTSFDPDWGQATDASIIDIDGDNTLRYSGLNYQGTVFNEDKQDVSAMEFFHVDYYTTDTSSLQFFLIDVAGESVYDIGVNEGITSGSWVSLDIPVSNWTTALTDLREIKVVGNGTIHFDNWYFRGSATVVSQQSVIQDFEAAGGLGDAFGDAAGSVVSDPETGGTRGQVAMLSANAAGTVWQGININISDNYELVSDKTMQMDVYSTTAIEFAPKAQGGLSGAPESVSSVSHTGSGWETLTITYDKSLDGKAPANGVYSQLALHYLWDINGGSWATPDSRVFYIDNIKATLSVAVDATLPTVASPAVDVSITGGTAGTDYISIFSDELTNITVTSFDPDWGQATDASIIDIDGDNTLRYSGLNYQGTVFNENKQDVSAMEFFHLDYYTTDTSSLQFFLIDVAGESVYDIGVNEGITSGSWVSLDIPVSNWTTALTDLREIKVVGNGTIHFDNWYFHGSVTVDPTAECAGQTADYAYTFETLANGTDVKVTIELLNTVDGLVAQFFNVGSGNQNPTLVSGQKYEHTFTGLTNGAEITFTAGLAWAAGGSLQISRTYTVGNNCSTASIDKNNLLEISLYPNPAKGTLNISAKNTIESATIYNVLGKKVKVFYCKCKYQ